MTQSQQSAPSSRLFILAGVALVLGLAAWGAYVAWRPREIEDAPSFPLSPIAESEFTNAAPGVAYVGAKACAECHEDQHATYLHTTHSRAFGETDPAAEPGDGEYDHVASDRSYRVFRKDGRMHHREALRTVGAADEALALEHPVRYSLGSNNLGRSYLVEVDGFLAQSPIGWYERAKTWDMSPGYDRPYHQSFTRSVGVKCLGCHVGRVEGVDHSAQRVRIHEATIGCESCHGPGSLHVERQNQGGAPAGAADLTIVNPARLTRERQEAVCAQCHLSGVVWVPLRGRDPLDYRPSLRLEDFRAYYVYESAPTELSAAGHIEQMHESSCYKGSQSLTCTTCHDPHREPDRATRIDFYRAKCLTCHGEQSCGLAADDHRRRERQDNCAACHMPRSKFSIPHAAVTHHRIGIHAAAEASPKRAAAGGTAARGLRPFYSLDHLSEIDRDRSLGLASYMAMFVAKPPVDPAYRSRAMELLADVRRRGLRDGEVDAALADLTLPTDPQAAADLAALALEAQGLSGEAYANSLNTSARAFLQMDRHDRAERQLERLVQIERNAAFWLQLAACRDKLRKSSAAIAAASEAVRIDPWNPEARSMLADLQAEAGQRDEAAQQRRWAERLRETLQKREDSPPSSGR